jgi:hypothetical protein
VTVSGIANATQIATGQFHSCARLEDATLKCWGFNSSSQLGDGTSIASNVPVAVKGVQDVRQIAAGAGHTCALLSGGTIKCWGYNLFGQIGNGTNNGSTAPATVLTISNAIQISTTDDSKHTCALLTGGTVKCWGNNGTGQLGIGSTSDAYIPTAVDGITSATQLIAGASHTCALLAGGTIKCWGWGVIGQLGNGANDSSTTPVVVVDKFSPDDPSAFTGVPSTASNATTLTIGFTLGEPDGAVECRLDGGAWSTCTSVSSTSGSYTVSGLTDGSHSMDVRQTDDAGNASNIATSPAWTVDTAAPSAPQVTGAPPSPTMVTSAALSITGESGATFMCSVDGATFDACASTLSLSGLAAGPHSVVVKAVDAASNASEPTTATWTVLAPIGAPTVLTTNPGTMTVYKSGSRWAIKGALLFSTGGDTRSGAQILTLQVAVDSMGRPVSTKPSDQAPLPTVASYTNGIVGWQHGGNGEVLRQSIAQPVWVRVGNRAGKWTGWVKLTV